MRNIVLSSLCVAISLVAMGCSRGPEMQVRSTTVGVGEPIVIDFDRPLSMRAHDKKWVTLVPEGADPSAYNERVLLSERRQRYRLQADEPGNYELRVHRGFPAREYQLVKSVPIVVTAD